MKTNHTKGEWEIKEFLVTIGKRYFIERDNVKIAEVRTDIGYTKEKEVEANANLIAAAPELLEALQELVAAIENEDIVMYDNLEHDGLASTPNKIYSKIKKAIQKATP